MLLFVTLLGPAVIAPPPAYAGGGYINDTWEKKTSAAAVTCSGCSPTSYPPPPKPYDYADGSSTVLTSWGTAVFSYNRCFNCISNVPYNYGANSYNDYGYYIPGGNNQGNPDVYSTNCFGKTKTLSITYNGQTITKTVKSYGVGWYDKIYVQYYYNGATLMVKKFYNRDTSWGSCLFPSLGSLVVKECVEEMGPGQFIGPIGQNVDVSTDPSPTTNHPPSTLTTYNGATTWTWQVPAVKTYQFNNYDTLATDDQRLDYVKNVCRDPDTVFYEAGSNIYSYGNYRIIIWKKWRTCSYYDGGGTFPDQFLGCTDHISHKVASWWSYMCPASVSPALIEQYRDIDYGAIRCTYPNWSCTQAYPTVTSPTGVVLNKKLSDGTMMKKSELAADGGKWTLKWPNTTLTNNGAWVSGSVTNWRATLWLEDGSTPYDWSLPLNDPAQPVTTKSLLAKQIDSSPSQPRADPFYFWIYQGSDVSGTPNSIGFGSTQWFTANFYLRYLTSFDGNSGTATWGTRKEVLDADCLQNVRQFVAMRARNTGASHTY